MKDTFLTDEGTYNLSVYNKIVHSGGVGDIAGRNFDINGNEIQSNITGRIISISPVSYTHLDQDSRFFVYFDALQYIPGICIQFFPVHRARFCFGFPADKNV